MVYVGPPRHALIAWNATMRRKLTRLQATLLDSTINFGHCLGTRNRGNPYNLSAKYWQYTSNLYHCAPRICNAVPCWLLSLEEREMPQYASERNRSTPPICTGNTFEKIPIVGGFRKVPEICCISLSRLGNSTLLQPVF